MGIAVGDIVELVRPDSAIRLGLRELGGEAARKLHVIVRVLVGNGRNFDEFGAEQADRVFLLLALRFRDDDDDAVAEGLRAKNPDIKIAIADPEGAALYNYSANGELKSSGSSITEGIGQGRITANLEGFTPDFAYQIPDSEAIPLVFDLIEKEGICLGGSSGINIAGAIRLAKDLGPGHTIVTILCDYGTRYQSKLFNPEFLRTKNLPVPFWMDRTPEIAVPYEKVD